MFWTQYQPSRVWGDPTVLSASSMSPVSSTHENLVSFTKAQATIPGMIIHERTMVVRTSWTIESLKIDIQKKGTNRED